MNQKNHGHETFFFDTYALYGIALGQDNYRPYRGVGVVTTLMNLYELYYTLTREGHASLAEKFVEQLKDSCVSYSIEDVRAASRFRLQHKNKNMSYVDALGYTLSVKHDLLFLTGDKAFEHIDHVRYVK